jgi:hypothetical protein
MFVRGSGSLKKNTQNFKTNKQREVRPDWSFERLRRAPARRASPSLRGPRSLQSWRAPSWGPAKGGVWECIGLAGTGDSRAARMWECIGLAGSGDSRAAGLPCRAIERPLRYPRSAPLPRRPVPDALARAVTAASTVFQGVDAQCRIRPAAMGRLTSTTSTWGSASAASRATSLARAVVMLHPSSHLHTSCAGFAGARRVWAGRSVCHVRAMRAARIVVGVVGGPGEVRQLLHALGRASMCAPQLKCLHHMLPMQGCQGRQWEAHNRLLSGWGSGAALAHLFCLLPRSGQDFQVRTQL